MPETITITENEIPNADPQQPENFQQVKIFQQFGAVASVLGADIIPFQRGLTPDPATYGYYTVDQFVAYIRGVSAIAWGQITGTLSNQTDLQAALNAKAALTGAVFTGNVTAPHFIGQYQNLAGSAFINPDGSAVFANGALIISNAGVISAANLSGTNTGNVTLGTANGLSLTGQALSLGTASTSTTGALTSTDWNTFSNKQGAISLTTTGTSGPATLTGSALNIPQYSPGGNQYDVQLNNGASGFTGSDNLNFQGGYLTINGDSGYGQLQWLNSPLTGGYAGSGISGIDDEIIIGALSGDMTFWSSQAMNFSADTGNTNMFRINVNGTITVFSLAASELIATDASKNLQSLATTTYPSLAEISYVKGVTSPIQAQLNAKGSVTSVGMTGDGVIFNTAVGGSPITTSGTLVPALLAQAAAAFLAGPATGAAATPTFRAIAATDVPILNQNTSGNAATATALQNARTIGGVSFNGTANITVATATGGFTVTGGDLVLGANNLTLTGSIGATGARVTKGWFTDLQVTNAIAGSITGNSATVTNATFTTALTVDTGTVTLHGNAANTSALTIGAGAVSVSGANTGDVTIGTANGLSLAAQALSMALASSAVFGTVKVDGTTIKAVSGVISAGYTAVNISSSVTLTVGSYNFVNTSSARSLKMPAPASGASLYVKDISFLAQTNNITFTQSAAENLEGIAGSYIFAAPGGAVLWVSDGTNWYIFG